MPDAPAATPVLSTTRTSSPALARCQAVDRPCTPAPTTRCLTEAGRVGAMGSLPSGRYCLSCNGIAVRHGSVPSPARLAAQHDERRPSRLTAEDAAMLAPLLEKV